MEKMYGQVIRRKYDDNDTINRAILDDEVLNSIEKLSTLYYQLTLITNNKEFSNFRVLMKTDKPLIGKISPGKTERISITIGVVTSDSDFNFLP